MIVSLEELSKVRTDNPQKRIVLACGTFDILHVGHIDYLEWARAQGDLLVVAVPGDNAIKTEKNPRGPIYNELERMRMIDALEVVDNVLLTKRYYSVIKHVAEQLEPEVIAVYKDWLPEYIAELELLFPDVRVEVCTLEKINSSSLIREKIASASQ
jgi:cytidyltransferase-like protein